MARPLSILISSPLATYGSRLCMPFGLPRCLHQCLRRGLWENPTKRETHDGTPMPAPIMFDLNRKPFLMMWSSCEPQMPWISMTAMTPSTGPQWLPPTVKKGHLKVVGTKTWQGAECRALQEAANSPHRPSATCLPADCRGPVECRGSPSSLR